MHRELFDQYRRSLEKGPLEKRGSRRLAIAAPRGAAKSTFKTMMFPVHSVLYGRERYIAIVSATLKQARQRLANIRTELETNKRLAAYYSEELARRGKWNQNGINVNGVQIDVFSAGTELRGISHGPWRPTLVLLDDVEDSDAVRSPEQRERLLAWFNEVIENIGDSYTAIEVVGTLLHPDSLLANLLKRPDFEAKTFKSVEQFAERSDLWETWRGLYTDLADPRRAESAREYFNKNRAHMLRGTRVVWQKKEDYYDLMCQMTSMGRSAFFKEKQNEPAAAVEKFFDLSRAAKFKLVGETVEFPPDGGAKTPLSDLTVAGFLDSAVGRGGARGKGDYAAIVTCGVDRAGYIHVLDVWLRRAAPTAQISAMFDLFEKWDHAYFGVETNCFQQLLLLPIEEERKRRKAAGRPWQLPVREVHHSKNKEMRIGTLEPLATNGWLRFASDLPDPFWAQLEAFPHGEHDDGVDALEGAVSLLRAAAAESRRGAARKSLKRLTHY